MNVNCGPEQDECLQSSCCLAGLVKEPVPVEDKCVF